MVWQRKIHVCNTSKRPAPIVITPGHQEHYVSIWNLLFFCLWKFARAPSCQPISLGSISDPSVLFVFIFGPYVVLCLVHLNVIFKHKYKSSIRPINKRITCRSGAPSKLEQKHHSNFRRDPIFVDVVATKRLFVVIPGNAAPLFL